MNIEVEIKEVRVIKDRRDDILNDAVRAVNDRNKSSIVDSREENAFTEDSFTVGDARSKDRDVIEDVSFWNNFDVRE